MRGVKFAVTPPCRMNVPSCTFRTRSTAGLNVTVNVIIDNRDAFATASGTVYGPPAVRNSCGAVIGDLRSRGCRDQAASLAAPQSDRAEARSQVRLARQQAAASPPAAHAAGAGGTPAGGVTGVVGGAAAVGGGTPVAGTGVPEGGGRNCGTGVVIGAGCAGICAAAGSSAAGG